jgi:hypothetical protein
MLDVVSHFITEQLFVINFLASFIGRFGTDAVCSEFSAQVFSNIVDPTGNSGFRLRGIVLRLRSGRGFSDKCVEKGGKGCVDLSELG